MNADDYAQLSEEHEALIQFLYLAPVGLVQASIDGTIGMMNPISAQLLMPLSSDGGLTNLFTALEGVAPDLRHQCQSFPRRHGVVCDTMHIHLNGGHDSAAPQILSLTLVKLDAMRLMVVLKDVTQQVRRERQLKQSDAWLNAILTNITDYTLVGLDRAGRVGDWNESVRRVTGHGPDVVGQPYSVFDPAGSSTPEHLLDRLREADAGGWSLDEGPRLRADGSQFWGSAMIAPLPDREPLPGEREQDIEPSYCLILRDISDRREANQQQRKANFCDHLTGVANRRAFFEAAERELQRGRHAPRPIALVMFDADHFKLINDRYGHPAGDTVLCRLAQLLTDTFRRVDVVARIGGEEFAVLLPSTDLPEAVALAERVRAQAEAEQVGLDGETIRFTVSAGVAAVDESLSGLDGLMKRADLALYAAKARGRNRVDSWTADCPSYKDHQRIRHDAD